MLLHLVAIALGGAVGAISRFLLSTYVYALLGHDFPYGTLAANVLGCLLMGFLSILLLERIAMSAEWRAALLIGGLGAFTTFSTFSLETLSLLQSGEQLRAFLNIALSILLCLMATWFGMWCAKQL